MPSSSAITVKLFPMMHFTAQQLYDVTTVKKGPFHQQQFKSQFTLAKALFKQRPNTVMLEGYPVINPTPSLHDRFVKMIGFTLYSEALFPQGMPNYIHELTEDQLLSLYPSGVHTAVANGWIFETITDRTAYLDRDRIQAINADGSLRHKALISLAREWVSLRSIYIYCQSHAIDSVFLAYGAFHDFIVASQCFPTIKVELATHNIPQPPNNYILNRQNELKAAMTAMSCADIETFARELGYRDPYTPLQTATTIVALICYATLVESMHCFPLRLPQVVDLALLCSPLLILYIVGTRMHETVFNTAYLLFFTWALGSALVQHFRELNQNARQLTSAPSSNNYHRLKDRQDTGVTEASIRQPASADTTARRKVPTN